MKQKNKNRLIGSASALATSLIFMAGVVSPASADDGSDAGNPTDPVVHEISPGSQESAAEFWTKERLEAAEPMEMPTVSPEELNEESSGPAEGGGGVVTSDPVAPEADPGERPMGGDATTVTRAVGAGDQTVAEVPVPSTVGRLFFTTPSGGSGSCSASTVAGGDGTKIITAGHCVHPGGDDNASWNGNFVFIPSYYKGSAPQGAWYGNRVAAFVGWKRDKNFRYDQAIVSLERKDGRTITQAVGANGLVGGNSANVSGNRIWGYPSASPFDGSLPYYCDGTAVDNGGSDSVMRCGMNEGASGGPWIKDRVNENLGYTWTVTSRCVGPSARPGTNCALTNLLASPNPLQIFDLLGA